MSLTLDQPPVTASPSVRPLHALQLGLEWFMERAGGADRFYGELVAALPRCGVTCSGLVAGSQRVALESGGQVRAFAPVKASVLQRWRGMRSAFREEIDQQKPDIIVSHFALYAFPVLRMIGRRHLPFAVHFQGPWASESSVEGKGRLAARAKALVESAVYQRAGRLIVLSDAFGKILAERYGIPADRIRRIWPGIDTARYRTGLSKTAARERLGWPTDRPIVLAVRRLVQRMGLENLIQAVQQVRRDVPDVLVLIAGKGPMAGPLEKQIDERGLGEHVRLLGFVPDADLPAAYTAADFSIVPSLALEGFGLIVIESLAAGTPSLVTPVGGLPEAVRDLSPELILQGSDPGSLARGLTRALRSPISLPSYVACQSFAEKAYDWGVIAPQVKAVYQEAMNCN